MRRLRDLTIKEKLLAITMVTLAVSLFLAGIGVVLSDSILFRSAMQRDLLALASIVGDNSTAALAFDDPRVATETLSALRARPHMAAACIYKPDGMLFAQYSQHGSGRRCEPPAQNEEIRFGSREVIVSHPILLTGRRVGTLVMIYDLSEATERAWLLSEIVLLILLVSSLFAFVLSSELREIIAMPLSRLAQAVASVSRTGDYSVRVEKYSSDELGVLVDAFNGMLARVQLRDMEVQNARYSLETTLTSIGDAVVSTDTSGLIVFANPTACFLLRRTREELTGRHIDDVFRIVDEFSRAKLEVPIHKVLRYGKMVPPSNPSPILTVADDAEFPVDSSAAPIRGAGGEMTGVVLVFRDISDRRATERLLEAQATELRQRAQLLKDADEKKDQFLAMLAHELRNPLAPIRNAVQVLKLIGAANENQRKAGDVIERQTQHLARLVDDLLDVSRITRGKVTLRQEVIDMAAVIERAVETSRPIIEARKHRLSVWVPAAPLLVKGDMTRLVQVVGNILNNAAKFMDEGGVVRLEVDKKDKEITVRVIDTGIGLSSDLLPHVFDLFTQADRSLDRSQGGLGIGLTLVRNLVELHGGKVEARSGGPGRGSEFIVTLPAVEASVAAVAKAPDQPVLAPSVRLRVLVVDDNFDSAETLRFMLNLYGFDVRTAFDGRTGLEIAGDFQPAVILCDIGLPGMSGYEVAAKLRANPQFKNTRLIALSGYGQEQDRLRSKEAGFDYHITKPAEPQVLTSLLESFMKTSA